MSQTNLFSGNPGSPDEETIELFGIYTGYNDKSPTNFCILLLTDTKLLDKCSKARFACQNDRKQKYMFLQFHIPNPQQKNLIFHIFFAIYFKSETVHKE